MRPHRTRSCRSIEKRSGNLTFENRAYEKLLITELKFILMEICMKRLSDDFESLIWEGVGREFGVLSFPI